MVQGIPTKYAALQFRSRLEAKWARFFDLCGWTWSYEPYDLAGWIPDFALGDKLQTLVEVKPVMSVLEIQPETLTKIENAVSEGSRVIVLGADPTTWLDGSIEDGAPSIGWAIDNGDLHFGWTEGNELPGLCCMYGAWTNYIWTFKYDERTCTHPNKCSRVNGGWNVPMDARTMLLTYWRQACNETQWMRGVDRHGDSR